MGTAEVPKVGNTAGAVGKFAGRMARRGPATGRASPAAEAAGSAGVGRDPREAMGAGGNPGRVRRPHSGWAVLGRRDTFFRVVCRQWNQPDTPKQKVSR